MPTGSSELGSPRSTQTAEPQSQNAPTSTSEAYNFSFQIGSSSDSEKFHDKSQADKFAHTRAKRKRTSREDFSVLEAEYEQNPRPDKATRSKIVGRVSLTDKEVQIWFQNRRQMTRRKCKTWQPNEITSIIRSSQDGRDEHLSSDGSIESSQLLEHDNQTASENGEHGDLSPSSSEAGENRETRMETETKDDKSPEVAEETELEHDETRGSEERLSKVASPVTALKVEEAAESVEEPRQIERIQESEAIHEESSRQEHRETAGPGLVDKDQPTFKRKSSAVRLKMSIEGKAKVVVGSATPSPEKRHESPILQPRSVTGLQRSQSLMSTSTDAPSVSEDGSWGKRRTHGRSRDARTWEFYCDSEARNSLNKAAEMDRQDSALGVIGLIRSGSGSRKPLTPTNKANMPLKRKGLGEHDGQKPKLARTKSSVARLQSISPLDKSGKKSEVEIWEDPNGDSDKENYDPDTNQARPVHPRPALTNKRSRKVLGESSSIMSHSTSLGSLMDKDPTLSARKRRQVPQTNQENQKPLDDEVASFMGEQSASQENDEMDAVQNLLSLSQGAWGR